MRRSSSPRLKVHETFLSISTIAGRFARVACGTSSADYTDDIGLRIEDTSEENFASRLLGNLRLACQLTSWNA